MTLRTLNYGNYGIFLIMGNAGFCPSAVDSGVSGLAPFNHGGQLSVRIPPKHTQRAQYSFIKEYGFKHKRFML